MKKVWTILHKESGEIANKKAIRELFNQLKDGKYLIEISDKNKRSLGQNAYLHGILIPEFKNALTSVGYSEVKTNEQAKLIMKSMFLTREMPNESGGKPVHYVQDTHDMTKEEMSILIEEVIQFAAENMNYQIPFPNEQLVMYQ